MLDPAPRIIGCEGKKIALYNREVAHTAAGCDGGDDRDDPRERRGNLGRPALGFNPVGL
jgi:hypothetical protein